MKISILKGFCIFVINECLGITMSDHPFKYILITVSIIVLIFDWDKL